MITRGLWSVPGFVDIVLVMKDDTAIRTLLALLRPQTYVLMCLYCVAGVIFGLHTSNVAVVPFLRAHGHQLALVLSAVALWYINGTALNDYADYEIDLVNLKGDKQRPLVLGIVTKRTLLKIAFICGAISLGTIFSIGDWRIIGLFSLMFFLNWAYSFRPFRISRRGGLAPLLLPLGYTSLTVLSGVMLTTKHVQQQHLLLAGAFYVHFLSRILLKDYRDVVGDKKAGKITLLLKKGNAYVVKLSLGCFAISSVMFLWLLPSNNRYLLPYYAFVATFGIWALYQLSKTEKWQEQKVFIPIYGRMCTALITLFVFNIVASSAGLSTVRTSITFFLITVLFLVSVVDIMNFHHRSKA